MSELASALSLGAGLFSSLPIMQLAPDALLLTDDAAARLAAKQWGYDVHGTIGIIARALPRRQRTKRQVLNLLCAIPNRSTLFISDSLLASVIEQVRAS